MKNKYPLLLNAKWLASMYAFGSLRDIAKEIGCDHKSVLAAMRKFGIETRHKRPVPNELEDPSWLREKYDSNHMSSPEIAALLGRDPGLVCYYLKKHGIRCRKPGKPFRKRNYYRYVGKNTKIHRKVMQELLERKLQPYEHVHHRNGIRYDNRPENLEVMSVSEHSRLEARIRREKRQLPHVPIP